MAALRKQFLICIFLALPSWISSLPTPTVSKSTLMEKGEKASSLFALDIESCTCKPTSRECEVAIASSIFAEIRCPEDQHFCCSVAKKRDKGEEPVKAQNSSRPAVKVMYVTPEKHEPAKVNVTEPVYNMTTKIETRCRCKLREKCSEKNTDYSFGFHCSYDKVRCCEAVDGNHDLDEGDNNAGGGRLINVFTDPENEKLSKSCRCLPTAQCSLSPNEVSKRKDTACPDNLIQCCGEAIAEKKSDDDDATSTETEPEISTRLFTPTATLVSPTKASDVENVRPPQHQPVPIPLVKIPSVRDPQVDMMSMTTTLPPPNLPNHYQFSPATLNAYNRYYLPVAQKPLLPNQYLIPSRPYSYRLGNRYAINQYGRGLAEQQRSSGTFLSNLASILG